MLRFSALPRTLPAALRDVHHAKTGVRLSAARDLGRLATVEGRASCLAELTRLLREDPSDDVRAGAAVALADARGTECVSVLVRAFSDRSPLVREMALLALGEVALPEDAEVQQIVEAALGSAEPPVRFQALMACSSLLGAGAQHSLKVGTSDPDGRVRALAWRLLEHLSAEEPAAIDVDAVVAQAQGALEDPSTRVGLAAAILLARLGSTAGAEVIERALNGMLPLDPEDEQAAIEAAGQLGLQRARPGLERRSRGGWHAAEPFAWHARVALARLGDGAAQRFILRGLRSWSRDTRTLAVAAAGNARLVQARAMIEAMRGDPTRAEPDSVETALELLGPAREP